MFRDITGEPTFYKVGSPIQVIAHKDMSNPKIYKPQDEWFPFLLLLRFHWPVFLSYLVIREKKNLIKIEI